MDDESITWEHNWVCLAISTLSPIPVNHCRIERHLAFIHVNSLLNPSIMCNNLVWLLTQDKSDTWEHNQVYSNISCFSHSLQNRMTFGFSFYKLSIELYIWFLHLSTTYHINYTFVRYLIVFYSLLKANSWNFLRLLLTWKKA